jgi:hypothetical protein
MRATLTSLAALLLLGLATSAAQAQYLVPASHRCSVHGCPTGTPHCGPVAPGPVFGGFYGNHGIPGHGLNLPYQPYQGPAGGITWPPGFSYGGYGGGGWFNPYTRSPRDFFME